MSHLLSQSEIISIIQERYIEMEELMQVRIVLNASAQEQQEWTK